MVETGTLIDGRYEVVSRIGSGGMADVYLAQDTLLGRKVAVKLLQHRFAQDQEFVERFRREASSAAGLSHPNVVAVFDRGEWDGTYYIAMEYLSGRSLASVIREHGPIASLDAIDIVVQILLALRFAHKRGIIHRDIKPHNVILDEEGRAKVTDFGIARAGASDMTLTGSIMGTAQYLSPEQAQGHFVGESSDLYAVGVVLYELLTGAVPFEGESPVTIALKQVSAEPAPPSVRNPDVSPALDAVVMRALAKDPARRFANADEFIAALGQARQGVAPVVPPTPNGEPTAPTAMLVSPPPRTPVPPLPRTSALPPRSQPPDVPPPFDDEQETARRRYWVWAAIAVASLAAAVAALLLLAPGSARVRVPDVTGQTQAVAVARLQQAGLRPAVSLVANASVASGTVIGETPPHGTLVKKGSTVSLYVSSGPGSAALPDVTGQPSALAVKTLRAKGFSPTTKNEPSETVATGRVISTDPTPGTDLQLGSPVTVLVSMGPAQVSVPSVTGQSQDAATATLTGAGLQVGTEKREVEEPSPGTVISQSPAAGTLVKRGTKVTIVVSQPLKRVPVPDVVGQGEEQAMTTLSGAGFTAKTVSRTVTDPTKNNVVVQQSPAGGAKALKGATVTLAVGKLAQQTTSTSTSPTPTPPSPPAGTPAAPAATPGGG